MNSIGIANLPNQLHKIATRKGSPFNLMVVGESGLGKTTFVNCLFTAEILSGKRLEKRFDSSNIAKTTRIEITRAVIEEKGFKVDLSVVDTPGFGDYVNNDNCVQPIVQFIDSQFDSYFKQDSQPVRSKLNDPRIHACLYFIPPTGQNLRPIDVEAMKQIGKRTNLIPVIAKADTISKQTLAVFKERIRDAISHHNISVYTCPIESDDEETTNRNIDIMSAVPFALISSVDEVMTGDGRKVLGRQYLWGVAEVENDGHCDFRKLRSLLIRTHMHDLIITNNEIHYENFRLQRIENRTAYVDKESLARAKALFDAKIKEEEQNFRSKISHKVYEVENRLREWEKKVAAERSRLQANLEFEQESLTMATKEIEQLELAGQ